MRHQRCDGYVVHDAGVVALPLPAGVLAVAIRHDGRRPLESSAIAREAGGSDTYSTLLFIIQHLICIVHLHCA